MFIFPRQFFPAAPLYARSTLQEAFSCLTW